jgi:hypothetical protein
MLIIVLLTMIKSERTYTYNQKNLLKCLIEKWLNSERKMVTLKSEDKIVLNLFKTGTNVDCLSLSMKY